MGFLDDLKRQADAAKAAQQTDTGALDRNAQLTDAAQIHKAGLNKPFARIKFDFALTKEVAGAPGTIVQREHAPAA